MQAHALEARRLMSAVVENGVLVISGTPVADRILAYEVSGTDGKTTSYSVYIDSPISQHPPEQYNIPADGVRSIAVRAGAGDDSIDLFHAPTRPDTRPVTAPAFIDAGFGNDQVYGGRGRDLISGGFGDDVLNGVDGDDWINGGWGRDLVLGGSGNDLLFGGAGNDFIDGMFGDDRIYGGPGDDVLGGDQGNDRLYGGAGNDRLGTIPIGPRAGEVGDDYLDGGEGTDRLYGGPGTDRMFGGPGRDVWLQDSSAAAQDTEAERIDRTPDEPIQLLPPTR